MASSSSVPASPVALTPNFPSSPATGRFSSDNGLMIGFSKEGELLLKKKKKKNTTKRSEYKPHIFRVAKGSVYYFPSKVSLVPQGVLNMETAKVLEKKGKKKFSLVVEDAEGVKWQFVAPDDAAFASWKEAFTAAVGQEFVELEFDAKKLKDGMIFRCKKNLSGKVATSAVGKAAIHKVLNQSTLALLNALKGLIACRLGKDVAEECEKSIIKIVMKSYFQMQKGHITEDQFLIADTPMRAAFTILSKLHDYYGVRKSADMKEHFKTVEDHLKEVNKMLTGMLAPHLTPESTDKLNVVFNTVGTAEFLMACWDDPDCDQFLSPLAASFDNYLAFSW